MEVTWPEDRCELSPNHAHYFRPVAKDIWRCKYCWLSKWTPFYWTDAIRFSNSIVKMGVELAYQKHLHYRPGIKRILEKLEEIRLLRKVLPEKQLMEAVAAIVTDKEAP